MRAPTTDGERIFAIEGRNLVAHAVQDGRVLWQAPYVYYMPQVLTYRDGRVFVAETVVLGFDAATGRELWRTPMDSAADLAHGAADDRAFYTGTRSRRAYALDVADGHVLWNVDVGPDWRFGGIIKGLSARGDTVYVTADRPYAPNSYISSGWIFALDRHTGRILWRYENGRGEDARTFISPPVVAGRLILASDFMGNAVIAVDRFSGREIWRVEGIHGYLGFFDPPVVAGDTVYAASGDTYVYALELQTGRVLW